MRKPVNAAAAAGLAAAVFLAAGLYTGWHAWRGVPEYARLLNSLSVHINNITAPKDATAYFIRRVLSYAAPVAAMWSLAFVPPAAFLSPVFVFIKGAGLGFSVRLWYAAGGTAGLRQAAALMLPQNLLLVPAFCLMASDSMCQALGAIRAESISRKMGGLTAPRMRLSARGGKPGYPAKLLTWLALSIAAAAWEAWLTVPFSNIFFK